MGDPLLSRARGAFARRAAWTLLGLAGLVAPIGALSEAPTGVLPETPAGASPEAPRITRVEVRGEGQVDLEEVRALVALVPGAPLEAGAVRDTLIRLRLAGLASEVEVLTRPAAGGVEAVVVLRADVRVESVEIAGEAALPADRLAAAVDQKAGRPLREDRVLRGVYGLEELLEAEGYLDAEVGLDVAVDARLRRARVTYRLDPGARWQVGEVRLEGVASPAEERELLAVLRAGPGRPYRSPALRDDSERLTRALVAAGYRLAQVEALPEHRDAEAARVDLAYRIERGPRLELRLVGAERDDLEKRDLLPFLGEAGYDEALLLQAAAQIRSSYQQRGHWQVRVETREERRDEPAGEVLVVHLEIEPGPRFELAEIAFEGNASFAGDVLVQRMALSPRRPLVPGSGRLVDEQLAADLSNLRSFYAVQGFGQAKIGPARVETIAPDRLRLVVPIVEGERQRIGEILFEGNQALTDEQLAAALRIAPGGPFHRVLIDEALELLRLAYEREGYRAALASARVGWDPDRALASVRFDLLEGERSTVDAVVLRGQVRTPTAVLRRFVPLAPGDPISGARLLEVQRALYRLGIFSRVEVTVAGRGLRAGSTVLVEVEEGRVRSVGYGFGYDSESGARGLLRLAHANLFGRAASLSADALVSEREEVYRLLYRQPYLGPVPVEFRGSVYRESENHPDFDVLRRGLQLGVQRDFGRLLGSLVYDYRIVELESEVAEAEIPLESRDARVASLTPIAFYDRRDDPIDPRRGWSLSTSLERAFPAFAANSEFRKLFGQGTGYVDLGDAGVLATSLRLGAIENLREETDPAFEGIDYVPAAERFYAGGRTSHRAFERDRLGVPGETLIASGGDDYVPIGGGALVLVNLEYRFPIFGGLGGTLFADGGNVWRDFADVDPGEVRWGAGVGVRYLSPIGPLRLEVGWKLEREPWEPGYVWFVSLGNPF